jgi:signal transduction histidine kinase
MDDFSIEEYREQVMKYKPDEFFHVMAHDLRAPLATILGALSLLKDHPDMPLSADEYTSCMIIIEQSSQRLDQLIGSALEYGRIQYQKCKKATESPA